MPETSGSKPPSTGEPGEKIDRARRKLLHLFSCAVFGGIAATFATNAFRFLRPLQIANANSANPAQWTAVAPLAELTGDAPLRRKVSFRRDAGWASRMEERTIFVLPGQNYRVVSAACPHEGCEVVWRAEDNSFLCPCHDSSFAPDGVRTGGPARHGLAELPAQVENGVLRIRYQSPTSDDSASAPGTTPTPRP